MLLFHTRTPLIQDTRRAWGTDTLSSDRLYTLGLRSSLWLCSASLSRHSGALGV
jgi:hypothetical protein